MLLGMVYLYVKTGINKQNYKTMKKYLTLFSVQFVTILLFTPTVLYAGNFGQAEVTDPYTANTTGELLSTAATLLGGNSVLNADISGNHAASITFSNKSDYTMTLKIIYASGGLYSTIVLNPHSSRLVTFGSSNTFKLKIKAVHRNTTSYHDGGYFPVTCTEYEWTKGEMSFELSTYGSGLGPTISAKEFESNY